ncbi:MAG: helix-turn-helix domain-containing protein [Candidatus Omnitrophica bacterium]|nr:helix-turn-helix domain-containing protein [Candidatus Omnitrophota bacterium]
MATKKEFGKLFRDAREGKGFTVEDVSRDSHIHQRVIEDIENGEFDRLGKLYIRSFMKKYAVHLGLEVDDVLKIFDHLTKPKADEVKSSLKPMRDAPDSPEKKAVRQETPMSKSGIGASVRSLSMINILIPLAVVIFIFAFIASLRTGAHRRKEMAVLDLVEKKQIIETIPEKTKAPLKGKTGNQSQSKNTSDKTAATSRAAAKTPDEPSRREVSQVVTPQIKETEPAATGVELTLKARGEVWVQVFDGKKTIYVGTLQNGDSKTLYGKDTLLVWTGKGEFLDFTVDGKFIGKAADGVKRNISVSKNGIKIGDNWIKKI